MPELVDLIEQALTTELIHPGTGDGPIALPLPMFHNNTMPGEMARHFAEEAGLPHSNAAKLVAEALASLLEKASASATEGQRATETPAPEPAPDTQRPQHPPTPTTAANPRTPMPDSQLAGNITVTVNGETVMTTISDLQQFSADVQPGSRPPIWKKILVMAALDGVTHQAFHRIDITTDDDGGWTVQASVA